MNGVLPGPSHAGPQAAARAGPFGPPSLVLKGPDSAALDAVQGFAAISTSTLHGCHQPGETDHVPTPPLAGHEPRLSRLRGGGFPRRARVCGGSGIPGLRDRLVPEGPLSIAQCFNIGSRRPYFPSVPEGRPTTVTGLRAETGATGPLMLQKRKLAYENRLAWQGCQASLRDAGSFYGLHPTMNRWALVQMSLRDNGHRNRRSRPPRPRRTLGCRRNATTSGG